MTAGHLHESPSLTAIVRDLVDPLAEGADREGRWPREALRALQDAGFGGLVVPEAYGGRGGGMLTLARVCERIGIADASTALCFGMHCVATACIVAKATPEQVETLLEPIVAGRHLTTLALSEPGTGSHFYLPESTIARVDDSTYALCGTKSFVTNGGHADSYVMSAVASEETAPVGHFSLVLVPGTSEALRWGPAWSGWGMRGNSSKDVAFNDLRVPIGHRLGSEGDQLWYVFHVVAPYFLVAMAGTYLGVGERALRLTREHLKTRHYTHSGSALRESAVLQHKLGQAWAMVERARQLCYGAATRGDEGGSDALPALCAAKAEVATTVVYVVNTCMSMCGGMAYRDGALLQRLLRDARAAEVMSPTTDLLYTWIGRSLLDLPLLGE